MIARTSLAATVCLLTVAAGAGCTPETENPTTTLRDSYADAFLIGVALNDPQLRGEDPRGTPIVESQFNSITPENVMKWESIHPEADRYDFESADAFVAYGEANNMFIVGHTLVWHEQVGDWVFEHPDGTPRSRGELLAILEDHITTIVTRYRGRVNGWDVVNEALADDGSLRESPWSQIIGEDYIAHAFRFARAADPDAELYYNDYGLESAEKRAGAVRLLADLNDAGVAVDGIGVQTHMWMDWPAIDDIEQQIEELGRLTNVMVTELDIGVLKDFPDQGSADVSLRGDGPGMNPYTEGLPDSVHTALADRYAAAFSVFHRHRDKITRVTFWGVTDGDSWRNNWVFPGRTNHPLLFDRNGSPKPAFNSVLEVARANH